MPRVIDLTIPLFPGVGGHPMFRTVEIEPFHVHERDRRSNADLSLAIHTATHIDAPYHFVPDGITIDQVPPERFMAEGVLIDLTAISAPLRRFSVDDLINTGGLDPSRLRGRIAVFRTLWSNQTFGQERYFFENPSLTGESAAWVADQGANAVLFDMATDIAEPGKPVHEQATPVHRALLQRGCPIIENCTNLDQLSGAPFRIVALPLLIRDESGAPARVVAIED
jgi:kynurenine formamidase